MQKCMHVLLCCCCCAIVDVGVAPQNHAPTLFSNDDCVQIIDSYCLDTDDIDTVST